MKTIKISFTIITFLAISASSYTQVQLGLKAGLNVASQKFSFEGLSMSPKSLLGFHAGAVAEISLSDLIAIEPGLLISQKGYKLEESGETYKSSFNYLDIPVNIKLKLDAGGIKVFGQAGPVISYAISGTESLGSESQDISFEEGNYKRLDIGLGFGAGFQVSSIQVSLNYTIGMANIADTDEGTVKNNVLGISVAYLFGGK